MSVFVRARARPTQNQAWTCGPTPYAWPTYEFAELAAAAEAQAAKAHTTKAQVSATPTPRPNIATGFTSNPNVARAQARAARAVWPGAPRALAGQL